MYTQTKPKTISLFCGAGGCSLGFKQAGYDILYATDKDEAAVKTYQQNFPETLCVQKDINDIDFKDVLNNLNLGVGELDMLIGGPPCQGFSTAGTRFWNDPRNHLLKGYVTALDTIKPKWFLMENVEGLLTSNKGIYVYEAVKAFIELGYKIRLEKVYSHQYGVPQRRKRVLIIGNLCDLDFSMPEPTLNLSGRIFRNSDVTLNHAIGSLPSATANIDEHLPYSSQADDDFEALLRGYSTDISDHYSPHMNGIQLERMSALKPGQTMKDLPNHLHHESFKKRANRRVADGTPTEKRGGAPSGLKRLKIDEPCLTITGAATRELIHPTENRPLTIRECARIQTFPDDFTFTGSLTQKIQQIGNAIPPILARVFAEHIKSDYGFDNVKHSKGKLLGYSLTKADAMSPALKRTDSLLAELAAKSKSKQLSLLG